MGKRSSFERIPRDYYPTPFEAVRPLLPYLSGGRFIEPCAGDGRLSDYLTEAGETMIESYDIEPRRAGIIQADALTYTPTAPIDYFITNPPWSRDFLHPLIDHLTGIAPAWLLIDADWMHTRQSANYMKMCSTVISVGRVKWIPDSKMTGKDNCAWYLFYKGAEESTVFIGRSRD